MAARSKKNTSKKEVASVSADEKKIILQYYSAISIGKREYNSIEFPKQLLYDAKIEKTFLGLFYDLILVVKTKRGIAEYPGVNLSGLKHKQINEIMDSLQKQLAINRKRMPG